MLSKYRYTIPLALILGVAVAYARTQWVTPAPDAIPELALYQFVSLLAAPAATDGRPALRDLTLYPPEAGKMYVTGRLSAPNAAASRAFQLNTPVPFAFPPGSTPPSPSYTLRDYLKANYPDLAYRYAWYASDRSQYALFAIGSLILAGLGLPLLLRLAGHAAPAPEDPSYDLSRFQGEPAAAAQKPSPPAPDDDPALAATLAALESPSPAPAPSAQPPPSVPTPAPLLSSKPLELSPIAPAPEESKDYQGEFYPVARPVNKA